jgi:Tol biopolymer transport system component
MTRFALLTLIMLSAAGWGGSTEQQPSATGTLAFARGKQVWVMEPDGSGQRRLVRGSAPVWSRDGRQIVYSVVGPNNYGVHLGVINADGSSPRRLTTPEADYQLDVRPVWSPDGRRIAFTRYDSDPNYAIYIVAVRGGRERQLLPGGWPNRMYEGPTWAPGGRKIAFNNVEKGAVLVIRPDGSNLRVLATIPQAKVWRLEWSPDGRSIAFILDDFRRAGRREELWVMNADGTQPRRLVDLRVDNRGRRDADFAWSPDSRQIAFTSCCKDYEVFVVNADGSGLLQLTDNDDRVFDGYPVWSPDGRSIAFTTTRDGNAEIYIMNADGTDGQNVSQNPLDDFGPAWSP